jgi:DNA modification methylase
MNVLDQYVNEHVALYQGDCMEVLRGIPDAAIHLTVTSPPFAGLYTYSDSVRDAGNCADDAEFFSHFAYLIPELYRVTVPGRLAAIHCKQLVNYKGRDGMAGLRDFRGEIIRHFTDAGWAYHSEVCIWTDPVLEMQRTKSHGLLYKQLRADASYSRQGLPEYLLVFRRWAEGEGEEARIEPVTHTHESFPLELWQRYASPVWMDIRRTNVLNVQVAREDRDAKHICPLQLDVIERAIELWTNPGDVVLDPFAGIGSVGVIALRMKRRTCGVELKRSYFETATDNLERALAERGQATLFDLGEMS